MKKWLFIVAIIIILAGCGKEKTLEPVEINPEIDVCEVCNMSIAHEHYATELISVDGDVYKFDDIGCMIEYIHKDKRIAEADIGKQYVRDVHSGEWMEIEAAYHAYHEDFWTPMANGVISFKDEESAKAYIAKEGKGELYDYIKLLEHPWVSTQ